MKKAYLSFRSGLLAAIIFLFASSAGYSQGFSSIANLNSLSVSAITGEKPQSKVWTYAGRWFMVMPNSSGTQIWRLDGTAWTSVLNIDASTSALADCKAVGSITHILLFKGSSSSLVSVQYVPASNTYQLWTTRSTTVPITLDSNVETATIDIDGNGRMWLASDASTDINVRWSDSPYSTWSGAIPIGACGTDDICAVTAFNGNIGVLWSNQTTKRFGFKYHIDGADPSIWSTEEVPPTQLDPDNGAGMADDHLNFAVGGDGTIYAAVKTSWDAAGFPKIALLVRRTSGAWDNLYEVSETGTRGIVVLNETARKLKVIYTSSESGGNIMYKESPLSTISFGSEYLLVSGTNNNPTSTKQNYISEIVVLAANAGGTAMAGCLARETITGQNALDFDGDNDYVNCGTSTLAAITGPITLEAWVKPDGNGTQSIVKKYETGKGYELSLSQQSAGQQYFFRLNSSTTYRINSVNTYPTGCWTHVAATYDGSVMRIFVNGVQEGSTVAGPVSILTTTNPLLIGTDPTEVGGTRDFNGSIDEVRIWNVARTPAEIREYYNKEIISATGLVGRWGMNEGSGTSIENSGSAGAALNGTSTNGPLWVPGIPFGTVQAPSAPDIPVLVSPENAASGISLVPVLTWNASAAATSYQVQVSTVSDFSSTVFEQNGITSTSVSVTPALSNSMVYYWRVRAFNAVGQSSWSSARSFTTMAAPEFESNGAGYALDFDGTDDQVNFGNNPSVNITGSITLEAWIKPTEVRTGSIIKKCDAINQGKGYELYCGSGGKVFIRLNGTDVSRASSTTSYPTDGTWMHVAGTYDGVNTRIYINGKLEATTAYGTPISSSTKDLLIGDDPNRIDARFRGSIDEVRLWNAALSEEQIRANMCRKLTGSEVSLIGYWRFDEKSGILVTDESVNGNNGTITNMDPASGHVWSGAALGDASAYDYDAAGGYTAMLNHSNGDFVTAATTSGTITGIQVYRADNNAVRTGSTVPEGYTLDPLRFWGVKAFGTTTPSYTLVYNYSGNPFVTSEPALRLVKRNAVSVAAWTDALATLDTEANTLTLTGETGTEYALAVSNVTPPQAPSGLTVTSVSGSAMRLDWTDNSNDETGFEIERSANGSGGPFTLIATVAAGTVTYENTGLTPMTSYCYRVRTIKSGSFSDYTTVACQTTGNGPVSLSFQDGVNGYAGTRDTYTDNTTGAIATVRGSDKEMIQDIDASEDERRSLLRFDLSTVPGGAVVQSAELQLYVKTEGQGFRMYRMLTSWDEGTVTYASLGNRHFAPDGTDAEATINSSWPGVDTYTGYISVSIPAATIQDWIDGVMANHGWLMVASHADDGQRELTRESDSIAYRPRLAISYVINPPDQPVLIAPVDNAVNTTTSPSLRVTVSDPADLNLTVNYYGRKVNGTGATFSLVGLPDTQSYTAYENGGTPAMFNAQTQWVKDNQVAENIAFVSHCGDVIDTDNSTQWDLANTAISILDVGASVPYGIGIGNHDATGGSSALFNSYFGILRFDGRSYYGGHFGADNDNNYELFNAAGMDFIIIHLEYNPSSQAIQWADALLKANPARRAIITSHNLIGTGNPGSFSTIGQAIYDELKDNPNLFLMLCGHVPGEGRRSDAYNGSVVHTLLADYQSDAGGGNGYLRIMQFSPQTDQIFVKTYSPYLNQWITDSDSQFTLNYDMEGNGFQLIGNRNGIGSGSEASITWNDLESGTEYEWYVTVSNGENTVTGPVWSFTTAPQSVWTGEAGTSWANPGNWAGDLYPGTTNNVSIPDVANDPEIGPTMTVDCHDLIILSGGRLAIQATDESSGSLIVHGSASGTVTYNRTIPDDGATQLWHYIAPPISPASISSAKDFYPYDEVAGDWGGSTTNIQSGRGYTVIGGGTISFTGSVITSDIPVNVTSPYSTPVATGTTQEYDDRWSLNPSRGSYGGGGFNLLGNPYTSSISASSFIETNDVAFDPFYRAVYLYNGNTYNYIGSPVTGWDTDNPGSLTQTSIQAGQGFFVLAMVNNTQFTFTRTMQEHSPGAILLKSAVAGDRWPGIRLDAKLGDVISSSTIVFNGMMTTGLDPGYDVGQMSSGTAVEIYTSLVSKDNDINFARQALPESYTGRNTVPVGIDSEKGGEVTFSAFTVPLGTNKFWLEDRVTGIFTDLSLKSYTVNLPAKTYGTGRFFIYASVNTPTDIEKPLADENGLRIWTAGDRVIIKGEVGDKAICEVFDINGKLLLKRILPDNSLNTVDMPQNLQGVFYVRIIDGTKIVSRKVALL